MSAATAYTPLESLLLSQSLLQADIDAESFLQVSQSLQNNALIHEDPSYDATRLSAENIQQHFLQLLREELTSDPDRTDRLESGLSPSSKKRKLAAVAPSTLQDAREHLNKIPALVDRLYGEYTAHAIAQIRADEDRILALQEEIRELERREQEDGTRQDQTGASRPVVEANKDGGLANGTISSSSLRTLGGAKPEPAESIPQEQSPGIAPSLQSPLPPQAVSSAASGASKARNGAPQVLQAPQVARAYSPHPAQAQPRDASSPAIPPGSAQAMEAFKWEPPYQPGRPQQQQPSQPWPQSAGAPPHQSRSVQAHQQSAGPSVLLAPQQTGDPVLHYPGSQLRQLSTADASAETADHRTTLNSLPIITTGVSAPGAPSSWPAPGTTTSHGASSQQATLQLGQLPGFRSGLAMPDATLPNTLSTPTAPFRPFRLDALPTTPFTTGPFWDVHGSGTKWTPGHPSPSTPRPEAGDMASPAYELFSPVLQAAELPGSSGTAPRLDGSVGRLRGRSSKNAQRPRDASGTPGLQPHHLRSSVSIDLGTEEMSAIIKKEDDTPRPRDEVLDSAADDSAAGSQPPATHRPPKRKRRDTSPTPIATPSRTAADAPVHLPPAPPNHVLWTRGFSRVAKPVLDQIKSHRFANIFAAPVRESAAPGYSGIVLRPQDLKSIQNAINRGNKAAALAAQALAGGDPGTSAVWLPLAEALVPPLGIINSAQLEREMLHMFANAIMYNPDANRGPGPTFLRANHAPETDEDAAAAEAGGGDAADGDAGVPGYQMDENGVVNDTRAMFRDVQQLLTNLRNAEAHNGPAPPPVGSSFSLDGGGLGSGAPPTGPSTRHNSVGPGAAAAAAAEASKDRPAGSIGGAGGDGEEDGGEEHSTNEADASSLSGTVKRRRTTRGH